ncbi:diacylglycerol kinase [Streptomyces sp. NPDC026673]|uniref:diacylglycerol kinase n=1 Tax=Streptomyces sp. NPDC026673 TaxID=3155724 RepID=UPI0034047745
MVIDPAARIMDGESVRIAKDVLCGGASSVKIALPESEEEAVRVLKHRGRRRPVVVGDDAALLRTVRALHAARGLGEAVVGLVPVGRRTGLALALGVPGGAVSAARAVLDGAERELDLLLDDSGGIVLGALRINSATPAWWVPVERRARSLARTLSLNGHTPHLGLGLRGGQRLRIEADGMVLADLDDCVEEVSVSTAAPGLAEVLVRREGAAPAGPVHARTVTVSGRDFRYTADAALAGPVRRRTWTVMPAAWRLTVPRSAY